MSPIMIKRLALDYINNFISVAMFAEHYDLTVAEAKSIISRGRVLLVSDGTLSADHFTDNVDHIVRARFPRFNEGTIQYQKDRAERNLLAEFSA